MAAILANGMRPIKIGEVLPAAALTAQGPPIHHAGYDDPERTKEKPKQGSKPFSILLAAQHSPKPDAGAP